MRKLLMILALPALLLGFSTQSFDAVLVKAGGKYGYVVDSPKIKLNASGIIMHKMGAYTSVAARGKIVEKKNGLAKVEFKIFKMLAQKAMPTPIIMPQKGDTLILNYLYQRALIIAPNRQSYNASKKALLKLGDFKVISSDLFAAYLIDVYSKVTTRKTLRGFCRSNAVGTVLVALKKKAYLFDCINFDKLASVDVKYFKGQQKPFFSHITQTRGEIIALLDSSMGDYYYYYKQLMSY